MINKLENSDVILFEDLQEPSFNIDHNASAPLLLISHLPLNNNFYILL